MDGFGQKSWNKLWESIQWSRNCKLENYLVALGIPLIGKTAARTISKYFMKASVLFLTKLKNIISKVFLWLAKPLSLLGKALHMICMKPVSFMVINVKKIFLQFHNNNIFTLKNKKIKNKKKESIKKCRKL